MEKPNLAPNIADVIKFTKEKMLLKYELRDKDGIDKEYRNFRVFTRFLCIRGNYGSYELREYINRKMYEFRNMLIESGADWRN